ncbi:transmembrane protein 245 isoform X2 [Sitodiplosis mosellana]|uniref:transmembrane protein 245 isoform X2 n=1 Tax=Sitodiplosis mosellana TaxID=263140 RepID=UPI0024449937|nr:transmembrane protein 245 isoform X2 [Sitodiplosis mosellana]
MSTRPSPAYKRATDSFYQLWGNIKQNVSQQSQLKAAIYNLVIAAVVASCVGACLVLGPFLKPLIWALLVGAVLFPFKYTLSSSLKCWFDRLEAEDTHLLVGVMLAPLEALESFGEYLWTSIVKHVHLLIGGSVGLVFLRLFIAYAPKGVFCMLWRYIRWCHELCSNVLSSLDYKIVIAILIGYFLIVMVYWTKSKSFYFVLAGQSIWFLLLAYVCSFLGALQVPLFIIALTYSAAGFVYNMKYSEEMDEINIHETKNQSMLERCAHFWDSPIIKSTPNRQQTVSQTVQPSNVQSISSPTTTFAPDEVVDPTVILKNKLELNLKTAGAKTTPPEADNQSTKSQSAIYFKGLFMACLVTILYKQLFVLALSFIPILLYFAMNLIVTFGIKEYLGTAIADLYAQVQDWIYQRQSALLPLCLPGILKLNSKVHTYVRITFRDSVDTASSILVIILLILLVIFASVFCAVEIYSEAITVVQLGSDVVNYTINHRPELMTMFPEGMVDSMDDIIENAYEYGRNGIETYVDKFLKDADQEQRRKLKQQILVIWDRIIQYWMDKKTDKAHGPSVSPVAITDSIGEIVYNEAAQQGVISLIKSNIGTLLEVTDSIWLIVKQNLNVLVTIFGSLFSLLLGGGNAVITFFINAIIFLTALFYLLSNSDEKYYPLAATNYLGFASGPRIAEAIETSVSSVLIASAKLALFHGLFMWFTHTIFGARVVFLPAAFAAILAAVPFLGTYWCSLPAFLDLWLIQDRFVLGIILVAIHVIFPTTFVDPAIYADVSGGGHAYLTGLSIAGGMFLLGWEGAIFGPILLCLVVVIFNLMTNALKDTPSTPNPRGQNNEFRAANRRYSTFDIN